MNLLLGLIMTYLALGITAWSAVWSDPKGEARAAAKEMNIRGLFLVFCALVIIVVAPVAIFLGLLPPEDDK